MNQQRAARITAAERPEVIEPIGGRPQGADPAVQVNQYRGPVGVDGKGPAGAFRRQDFPGQYRAQLGGSNQCRLSIGPA